MTKLFSILQEGELTTISLFFALLGAAMFFLHIPKDEKFKYYRHSRYILGAGFLFVCLYCVLEPLIPTIQEEFSHKAVLSLVYLVFIWLLYSSFLALIFSSKYTRKKFILDGAIPIALMLILIFIGFSHPHLQHINAFAFALILGIKCVWMSYMCLKEFSKVKNELENYYEEIPHIEWMRTIIWLVLALALITIVGIFVPVLRYASDTLGIILYAYLTAKMLNYVPRKIEKIRNETVNNETEDEVKEEKDKEFRDKMAPIVAGWIVKKAYTQPDLSIVDVAREMGTNQNYLSRYLNSHLNMTFSIWLNGLRVEESKTLLANERQLSIEEIGQTVGFKESYNFSKWFKNITGETPYQFKKRNR